MLSHSNEVTDQQVKRACARSGGFISQIHFVLTIEGSDKSSKTDDTTRRGRIISGNLRDHTKLRFLSKLLLEDTKVWNTSQTSLQHSMTSEASWGTLDCRSSPLRAMSIRPSAIASSSGRAQTVPRLRRLPQMGAAIGWLQRNSRSLKEGRVSWPRQRGNSSRSSEGRVLSPRIGWVPDAFWTVRRPGAG